MQVQMQGAVGEDTVCADPGVRFVALVIDWLVLLVPNLVIQFVVAGVLGLGLTILLNVAYYVYFWTEGATLGKKAMGLLVVR